MTDAGPDFARLAPSMLDACAGIAATAPDPWSRENLQTAMDDPRRLVPVAMAGGQPAAFACFRVLGGAAELEQLAVAPPHRRRGIARALLLHALPQLAARGAARLLLEVRCQNAPAIALYQGLGFQTLARRPGMYKSPADDGFLMERALGGRGGF